MAITTTSTISMNSNNTPQLDMSNGGQQGLMVNPLFWATSSNYIRQKVMAVLISAPGLMQYMPNASYQMQALKQLIEVMPQKIDGLKQSLEWEYDGVPIGHSGLKLESPLKASREQSTPTFSWAEKYGQAITKYWTEFGRQLILDPDLQVPGIVAEPAYISAGSPAILASQQSFTVLYFEPDLTMTKITNAWLISNHMPKTAGPIEGSREMGAGSELTTVDIEFTGVQQVGQQIDQMAKNYLNTLQLNGLRPLDLAGMANGIASNVASLQGLASEITAAVLPPTA